MQTPAHPTARIVIGLALLLGGACQQPDTGQLALEYLESGNRFAANGQLREAVVEYLNATYNNPGLFEAHLKLAETYETLGEGGKALLEYIRAADLRGEDVALQLKAGDYLLAAGRPSDALVRAESALAHAAGDVRAHVLQGQSLAALRRFEEAMRAIETARDIDPSRGETYTQMGLIQAAAGQRETAEQSFRRGGQLAPGVPDVHLALANFYWSEGRVAEAEAAIGAAIRADERHERANRAMATLLQSSGRMAEAEAYLTRLLELSSGADAAFLLADYYIAAGKPQQAIAVLRPVAEDQDHASAARVGIARARRALGDRTQAMTVVEAVLEEDPEYPEALVLKARLLADGQDVDGALAALKEAVEADPTLSSTHLALGQLHAKRGDMAGAEAALREALRLDPGSAAAQVELSMLHLSAGRPADALSAARLAVERQPRSVESRLALARAAIAAGELDLAERQLSALKPSEAATADVQVQRGMLAAARGSQSVARAAFLSALDSNPRSAEALAGLLSLEVRSRDFAAVRRLIEERLLDGESPELMLLAARTYGFIGDPDAAESILRRIIEIAPSTLQAYDELARLQYVRGHHERAIAEFDRLAEKASNPVGALTMAGLIAQEKGDLAGAQARFERALAADPHAAVAANNLAWIFTERRERPFEAVRLAQLALDRLPDSPGVLDTLGWAHVNNGTPLQALPPLTRCAAKEPANGICRYHLGVALARLGEDERARTMLSDAIAKGNSAAWVADARRELVELEAKPTR